MKFCIPPDQAGYSIKEAASFVTTKLEGGMSRRRLDLINASDVADVQWSFDREKYRYFRAFFETGIKFGSLPFQLDMILDGPELQEYTVSIVEDTLQLDEIKGHRYQVSCKLEVKAKPVDDVLNQLIIDENSCESSIGDFLATLVQVEVDDTLSSGSTASGPAGISGEFSIANEDDSISSITTYIPSEITSNFSQTEEDTTLSSSTTYVEPT